MLQPLGPRCWGRAPLAGGDTGWWPQRLLHASAAACSGHEMHTGVSLCPELTASEEKPFWSRRCRDVFFHRTEGETEAQSRAAARPKPAASAGGKHASTAVPAGGWERSHRGGSWHTGYRPWPLVLPGWQMVPGDSGHTWSVQPGPHVPAPYSATQQLYLKAKQGVTEGEKNQNKLQHVLGFFCAPSPAPGPSSVIPAGMCLRIPRWLSACRCWLRL